MSKLDCETTKKHVHEYLHNELSPAEIAEITAHLANCDSCVGDYDVENILNQAISRACANDEAPEQLIEKIMGRIRDIQAGKPH